MRCQFPRASLEPDESFGLLDEGQRVNGLPDRDVLHGRPVKPSA
jgi:hypothetical protein